MPVNLRRTLLFASALQVLGPRHEFTLMMERLLSGAGGDGTEEAILDRLLERERSPLLGRYQTILSDLPLDVAAA